MAMKHRSRSVLKKWVLRVVTVLFIAGNCYFFFGLHQAGEVGVATAAADQIENAPSDTQHAASSALAAVVPPVRPQVAGPRGAEDSKLTEKTASAGSQQTGKAAPSKERSVQIGARKDSTGSIPVALRGLSVEEWMKVEAKHGPKALSQLKKGSQKDAKQGPSGVFGAVDVALPLRPPILQYQLNSGSGQAQKNIVGLKSLTKAAKQGRKCIVYGMGIAEESDFEQMMAQSGCETHAFDCTVDYEAEAVYKKKFTFHQWCIGAAPAKSQSDGENTYSNSATVRIEGKLPGGPAGDTVAKVVSGGKGGGGNRADFYVAGKHIKFHAGRGINVVTLDPATHEVLSKNTYDTFAENKARENARMASDLGDLPDGRIVMMAVMDTGLDGLESNGKEAMRAFGASKLEGGFRESYGFIGAKGLRKVAESRSRDMPQRLIFKTLKQTMEELGHSYLDLLKFDIEGFEWGLFASEILVKDRAHLPEQISFELHTKAANPAYVPQEVVGAKGFKAVNKLMLDLWNVGYRITSKEVNNGDTACAEFVAVNVE